MQRNLSGGSPPNFGGTMQAVFGYYPWNTTPGDSQGRLATVQTGTTQYPTRLQNLVYHYTVIGNIANITDVQGGSQVQNFTYDTLDRLLSANAVGGSVGLYSESYTYDPNTGNLSSKAGVNYTYSPTRVHAVTSLSNGNSYSYDNNGNMTSRTVGGVTYTLGYDAENRLVSLTGGGVTAAYIYDGDGNRVKTVVNGVTVTYIGNYFEWSNSVGTKYYYAGSVRVAVRVGTVLDYLFSDHLGSTSITADSAGNLAGGMRYTAWGETRFSGGATPTSFRYTGQRQAEAGLYFYVARWYDPALGRWTQPDVMVPNPGDPNGFNRYAYSKNNPIRFSDPTGHIACDGKSTGGIDCDSASWSFTRSDIIDAINYEYGIDKDALSRISTTELQNGYNSLLRINNNITKGAQNIESATKNIPGTPQDWNNIAKVFDGIAWLSDLYASGIVTYGFVVGAGIPAILLPEGIPEVPVVTGWAGMGIAELSVQPLLTFGNGMAIAGTFSTIIADAKDAKIPLESNTINSIVLTGTGLIAREAYLSLTIQTLSLSNDFGWTSIPVPNY